MQLEKIMFNNIHHEVYLNLSVMKGQCLMPIIMSNRSLGECVRVEGEEWMVLAVDKYDYGIF